MGRKAFRFHQNDLNNLAFMAEKAGVTESEKLRELIRSAAGGEQAFPAAAVRKKRRSPASAEMASLDPDTRLILVRACNLLNQAVKALHVARRRGQSIDLLIVSFQLASIEDHLIKVGHRQIEMHSKTKDAS